MVATPSLPFGDYVKTYQKMELAVVWCFPASFELNPTMARSKSV